MRKTVYEGYSMSKAVEIKKSMGERCIKSQIVEGERKKE